MTSRRHCAIRTFLVPPNFHKFSDLNSRLRNLSERQIYNPTGRRCPNNKVYRSAERTDISKLFTRGIRLFRLLSKCLLSRQIYKFGYYFFFVRFSLSCGKCGTFMKINSRFRLFQEANKKRRKTSRSWLKKEMLHPSNGIANGYLQKVSQAKRGKCIWSIQNSRNINRNLNSLWSSKMNVSVFKLLKDFITVKLLEFT